MADWFKICSFEFKNKNSVPGEETPRRWRFCDEFKIFAYLLKKAVPWSKAFWTILGLALRFSTLKETFELVFVLFELFGN